jgi:hypothetical protein
MFCLRIRSDHEETSAPEPHAGLQGESGLGCLDIDGRMSGGMASVTDSAKATTEAARCLFDSEGPEKRGGGTRSAALSPSRYAK